MAFATIQDVETLWRKLKENEVETAIALLDIVSDNLRVEAKKVNKDLDEMIIDSPSYNSVLKSVVVDIVARTLLTATDKEPMIQSSESALGYSWSGTYLVPGGGLFIKNSELVKLGLKKQRYGVMDFYDTNKRNPYNPY